MRDGVAVVGGKHWVIVEKISMTIVIQYCLCELWEKEVMALG